MHTVGPYSLACTLGQGSFATVYKGINLLTREVVAIKCVCKTRSLNSIKELNIMQTLSHPNIIKHYASFESSEHLFIVLEYCDMDLYRAITTTNITLSHISEIFMQVLEAVHHCHMNGVYHRDIKPENILISTQSTDYTICLADFGLATRDTWSFELGCGSSRYLAPECIFLSENQGYSPAQADIWSLGILLLNLLSGRNPWHKASLSDNMYHAYTSTHPDFLQVNFGLSNECNLLLKQILHPNPCLRLNIVQLITQFKLLDPIRLIHSAERTHLDIPGDHLPASVMDVTIFNADSCRSSDLAETEDDEDYYPLTPKFDGLDTLITPDKSIGMAEQLYSDLLGCSANVRGW